MLIKFSQTTSFSKTVLKVLIKDGKCINSNSQPESMQHKFKFEHSLKVCNTFGNSKKHSLSIIIVIQFIY